MRTFSEMEKELKENEKPDLMDTLTKPRNMVIMGVVSFALAAFAIYETVQCCLKKITEGKYLGRVNTTEPLRTKSP